jgi:glucose-1-phosphate thymidylyltransferase
MSAAANFIQIVEARQGLKISCLEEVAWRNGWLSDNELLQRAEEYKSSPFSQYLKNLLN